MVVCGEMCDDITILNASFQKGGKWRLHQITFVGELPLNVLGVRGSSEPYICHSMLHLGVRVVLKWRLLYARVRWRRRERVGSLLGSVLRSAFKGRSEIAYGGRAACNLYSDRSSRFKTERAQALKHTLRNPMSPGRPRTERSPTQSQRAAEEVPPQSSGRNSGASTPGYSPRAA